MTELKLAEEMALLYESIKVPLEKGNPAGLMDDLTYRCEWLARSAEIVADAQRVYDIARGEMAESARTLKLNPTQTREYIAGGCANEHKLLTLAERLNATLTHQIDAVRTLISYEKQLASQTMREGQ